MQFIRGCMAVHPVILSGGTGSRLWPLSRSFFPKQLLPLVGELSMLQETALRAHGAEFEPPVIICNAEHRFLIAEQMRATALVPRAIILEPEGRNTAPAATVAALLALQTDPEAILLLMPADQIIRDQPAFHEAIAEAVYAAQHGRIVAFGVQPRGPETGYGYIQRGAPLYGKRQIYAVERFVEKPDAKTALGYLESKTFFWNSGLFVFRAQTYLEELARLQPEILEACRAALAKGRADLDFFRLDEEAFCSCPANSVDYAVMEHTGQGALVPVEMGWDDIGSWKALWENAPKDEAGNAIRGDVVVHGAQENYLRSDGPLLAAVGITGLVVVATQDAVLVADKEASQDVKRIVEKLSAGGRELHLSHRKVQRPWGTYESLDRGERFQVKRISVKPGEKLSLQKHHKRAEHWIVVAGEAQVTCDDEVFTLKENQSTYIPLGAKHRLENRGSETLELIEVQSGAYLGEDDIVRFDDRYGR
jgi:mannose-1-phosphate guanylyltransferase/mannose-6-phosphate isomerase